MLTRVVVGRILASEMVSKPNTPRTICVLAFFIVASGVWGEDSITLASHLPDNDLHSLAGLSIAFLAAGAAANLGISPAVASLLALSSAILAGAAKEVADAAGFGTPELRDFLNTAAGGLVAATGVLFAMVAIASDQFQAVETTASLLPIALLTSVPIAIHLLR